MFPRPLDSQLARKGGQTPIFADFASGLRQVYPPRSGFKLARGTHLTEAVSRPDDKNGVCPPPFIMKQTCVVPGDLTIIQTACVLVVNRRPQDAL